MPAESSSKSPSGERDPLQLSARDEVGDHADNVVFDAVQAEYRDMASWYDCFWGSYTEGTLRRPLNEVLKELEHITGFSLVDVGCGTGVFLRRLLNLRPELAGSEDAAAKLIGVEPSKEMLEEARKKFSNEEAANEVELMRGPAEHLPLPNDSADMIVSTNAFHFFRDKRQSLQEMKRVLKANGVVLITDWCSDYWLVKLYHLLERIRWNWRFEERYPSPLMNSELLALVKAEGWKVVESATYRVRVFGIFFWGMQTVKMKKSATSATPLA